MNPAGPTPEQQKVLDRIAAQRERVRAYRADWQARAAGPDCVDPNAPLAARLLAFARLHPLVTIIAVGAAAGPRRLLRWAAVLAPLLSRMR